MSQYETLYIFIFFQQRAVGCAKYALPFLKAILEVEPFLDKPGNLGNHPTERITGQLISKIHLDFCEKQTILQKSLEV